MNAANKTRKGIFLKLLIVVGLVFAILLEVDTIIPTIYSSDALRKGE